MAQCALQRGMQEILGILNIASDRQRESPQSGQEGDQFVADRRHDFYRVLSYCNDLVSRTIPSRSYFF